MLNCGNNTALDDLTGKADEIKAKLAEGMAALGDLESKAGEITSALNDFAAEIPTFNSLQADLNTALSQATTDASAAFATFREKWGDAIPEAEIQEYLDTITSIASDPASLLTFDPCKAFPNKELNPSTGVVEQKAKKGTTPNTSVDFSEFLGTPTGDASPTSTTYESKITPEMTAWTQARRDNMDNQSQYFETVYKPYADKFAEMEQDPDFISLDKKIESSGKKSSQLIKEGRLTEGEMKVRDKWNAAVDEVDIIEARDALMSRQLIAYEFLITGEMPQETYDSEAKNPQGYLNGGKDGAIPQADIDKFNELAANLDANVQGGKEWKAYRDARA
ncbi:MAG: hypothetical protein CMB73_03040 [Euryarchaeota archaeon]|nr:hypothetical protein [Euryarchaeota archaeon]|tara:strand:- start:25273 stop:26277 length:1005 start_codon:yes stop_codon:yes gene_type:complete